PSSTVATALTYRVTVTDVENGVAAEDVVIGLLPGSGWRLRYFTPNAAGKGNIPGRPVRIPDGGSQIFLVELTPEGPASSREIVLRIAGLNAPIIPAIPGGTVIRIPDSVFLPQTGRSPANTPSRAKEVETNVATCPALRDLPTAVDFGIVPIRPYTLTQDRLWGYYGEPAAVLFWDDQRRRLVPAGAIEKAPVVLRVSGADLVRWQRAPQFGFLLLSSSLASLHVGAPGQFISKGGGDIGTADAAFLLPHMRGVETTSPFAVLYWRSSPSDP